MRRFSHWLVAVGQVPSTGKADTGRESPFPAISTAVTRWTKSGARAETNGGRYRNELASPGSCTCSRWAKASSTTAKFRFTISRPRFP